MLLYQQDFENKVFDDTPASTEQAGADLSMQPTSQFEYNAPNQL